MNIAKGICALLDFAYQDGLNGIAGYPLDADATASAAEKALGSPINREAVKRAVELLNREYERGRVKNLNRVSEEQAADAKQILEDFAADYEEMAK